MGVATNLSALCALLLFSSSVQVIHSTKCLPGDKHKPTPSAEGAAEFVACKAYKDMSCCKASFTKQLAKSPITAVENFSWTPCGQNLSSACQAFMVKIECFYRCSPNVVLWENPEYPSAFIEAPLCSGFCDGWFEACKSDLTCARNWQSDFNFTTQPSTCKTNARCKSMTEMYTDAKDMCENIWGKSFVYKQSKERHDCFDLNSQDPHMNEFVADYYFGHKGTTPPSSGDPVSTPKYGYIIIAFSGFISVAFISRFVDLD